VLSSTPFDTALVLALDRPVYNGQQAPAQPQPACKFVFTQTLILPWDPIGL
jgi:hypothetical protein